MSNSKSFGRPGGGVALAQMLPCAGGCGRWMVMAVGSVKKHHTRVYCARCTEAGR